MLRHRNDASLHSTLRPGSTWYNFPRFTSTVRRHDCGGNPHEQDGTSSPSSVRPDARPAVGHLYGQLCERRRILSLQLFRNKRLRQDCTGRYLRPRMPAYIGSADVWHIPAAEEDETYEDHTHVVQEVE